LAANLSFCAPPIRDGGEAGCKINRRYRATSDSGCSPAIQMVPELKSEKSRHAIKPKLRALNSHALDPETSCLNVDEV